MSQSKSIFLSTLTFFCFAIVI